MNRLRARLPWYASVAFIASLLVATPPRAAATSATRARLDAQSETQSTQPAARLQPSDDALRPIDRSYFEPTEPPHVALVHTIPDAALARQSLQPASSTSHRPHARAPPAHR